MNNEQLKAKTEQAAAGGSPVVRTPAYSLSSTTGILYLNKNVPCVVGSGLLA